MSLIGDGLAILNLVDKGRNAPLYMQLGEWIDKVAELQGERDELIEEIRSLRERARLQGAVQRLQGHTYVQGSDDEICPACMALHSRLVFLEAMRSERPPYVKATCPACKTEYLHNRPVRREPLGE
jgi:hypothetical protein